MQTNRRYFPLTLIGVIALVIVAFFVFTQTRCSKRGSFRVAFNTWVGYGPFYVAKEKGFFKDEGLDVDLQRIEGTGDRRAALIAGRIEALGSTIDDLVVGASQGVTARMVLAIDESSGADGIVAVNSIKDIKDLKGKTVAVQPGFVNHFFLLYLLDKNGIAASDVKVEAMEPDAAGLAFVAQKIDVAVTWEPYLSRAKERPDGHVLITTADPVARGVIVDNLIVRDDVIQERKADIERLIRAWFKAVQYIKTSPDDANAIIGKAFGLSAQEAAGTLKGVKLLDEAMNRSFFSKSENSPTIYKIADKAGELYLQQQLIKSKPNVDNLIDTEFVVK